MIVNCVDCGIDISFRWNDHAHPYLCSSCADIRRTLQNRHRSPRTEKQLEANRKYQREWARGRSCAIRIERCEDCGLLYTAHGPGHRLFCYLCAVFQDRERCAKNYRRWLKKYRLRERIKANERWRKRQLRRAA